MPVLHLICGLPGAGKTTLASKLERELPVLRLAPDEWIIRMNRDGHKKGKRKLVEELQWDVAKKALRLGQSVVLENGFWSRDERLRYREEASALGAKTKLYYLNLTPEELKNRIRIRNENVPPNGCFVNPDLIDIWMNEFEAPGAEELKFD